METPNKNLLINLRKLRDQESWSDLVKIGQSFLSKTDQQLITKYSLNNLIHIYDELLIGCWWGHEKDLSREFASRINNLLNNVYLEEDVKQRILGNLGHHQIKYVPDMSIGERCLFTNDNDTMIYLPTCNVSLCKFASEYKNRNNHEVLFRQICSYLIKNKYIQNNIIDLGAWIGDNSIPWAKNIYGMVYAIDPSGKNCQYIKTIAKLNKVKNVEVIQSAISNVEQTLSTNDDIDHCALNSDSKGNVKIKSTTLDILHQKGIIKDIDFVHLDVEGMEWSVIQGAKKLIENYLPIIAFEQHLNTDNYQVIINYLKSKKYRIFLINEQSGGRSDCRNFISFPSLDPTGNPTGIPLMIPWLQKHLFFKKCGDCYGGDLNLYFGDGESKVFGPNNQHLKDLGRAKIGDCGKIIFEDGKLVAYLNGNKVFEIKARSSHYHAIIAIYDSKVSLSNIELYEGDAMSSNLWSMSNVLWSRNKNYVKANNQTGYNSRMISLSLTNLIEIKLSSFGGHFRFGLVSGMSKSEISLTEY